MILKKGKNYLLAIAINNYPNFSRLKNCIKDSEGIINILLSRYTFKEQDIERLYNESASKERIFEELDKLHNTLTENDNLLIYFAGHGYYDEKSKVGYFIHQNAKKGDYWNYISHADFRDKIKAIPTKHTFLILDSCFSGALIMNSRAVVSKPNNPNTFAKRVYETPSHWCFAAGVIEEVEDGLHGQNSPFAEAIIDYLRINEEICVPISELIQYVKKQVSRYSKQTPIEGIFSKEKKIGGQFVFFLKTTSFSDKKIIKKENLGGVR